MLKNNEFEMMTRVADKLEKLEVTVNNIDKNVNKIESRMDHKFNTMDTHIKREVTDRIDKIEKEIKQFKDINNRFSENESTINKHGIQIGILWAAAFGIVVLLLSKVFS